MEETITKNTIQLQDFVRNILENREGNSHGYEHAISVRDLSLYILQQEEHPYKEIDGTYSVEIIEAVAMLHDICDHKYSGTICNDERKKQMNNILLELFSEKIKNIILTIIEEISFSKEKKNKNWHNLKEPIQSWRHIVSDADKIEALGINGIRRCLEYQLESNHTEKIVLNEAIIHCEEKILRLLDEFIHTKTGKKLAEPQHEYVQRWYDYYNQPNINVDSYDIESLCYVPEV